MCIRDRIDAEGLEKILLDFGVEGKIKKISLMNFLGKTVFVQNVNIDSDFFASQSIFNLISG